MITDSQGHELVVTQELLDRVSFSELVLSEKLKTIKQDGDLHTRRLTAVIARQNEQIDALKSAVATLESYVYGLQDAVGIEAVEHTATYVGEAPEGDGSAGTDQD